MLKSGGGEMEIAMQQCWAELREWEGDLHFSVSSSTTTTPTSMDDDMACEWDNWALDVDWKAFAGEDDFGGLIESMINQDCDGPQSQEEPCNSVSTSTTTTTSTMATAISEETSDEDSKGLRVVHLLIAAAEALTGANKSGDLARVILVRLKELVSPTIGSNMERIAACFADALQGLLEGTGLHNKPGLAHYHRDIQHHHPSDVLAAFQLLQDMSPYVKFGHFTANQAILEAVAHERRVHIVDYDIMEGIQWASLMQALVSRKDGPPTPHLRITALTRGGGAGRRSIGTIQETGRRLVAFAASIGQPFSFHQCRLDPEENFRPSSLKLVKGDALVINCMLHLPHFTYRSPGSVLSFLSGASALGPKLITLVEEEAGPTGGDGFVGRFMDSLHHYSALYDSLEAGFPMQGRARALVEKVFLGPRIAGSVAKSYCAHKGEESWGEWISAAGFEPVAISFFNHCQAKLLLGLFNDGYRVEEVAANKIVLGWKSRRILSASIWTPPQNSPLNSYFPS